MKQKRPFNDAFTHLKTWQVKPSDATPEVESRASSAKNLVSDERSFAELMGDVQPLKTDQRGHIQRQKKKESVVVDHEALADFSSVTQAQGQLQTHQDEQGYFGFIPGFNHTLLTRLRSGEFRPQHTLDLHGLRIEQAKEQVWLQLRQSFLKDQRTVLIVTGKGKHSITGESSLREAFIEFVSHPKVRDIVLAYATAHPRDGGDGAFYVLLRRRLFAPRA